VTRAELRSQVSDGEELQEMTRFIYGQRQLVKKGLMTELS
jgi:hypothetical protein